MNQHAQPKANAALRELFDRERQRQLVEKRAARDKPPMSAEDAHRPVSNRAERSSIGTFEPAYGSLGKGQPTAGGIHEVVATPAPKQRSLAPAADAEPPLDAYWASYGDATDRALLRQPGVGAMIVIDTDDRIEVTNNEAYPWRCVCSLLMTAQDATQWIGTGWLVSPRLVLTAGHCVYFHSNGGWPSQIEVTPGRRGDSRPFGSAVCTDYRSVQGWTQDQNRDYDYGAILLPEANRFGDQLGWFGYTTRSDDDLKAATLNLAGYPGDKPAGTQWYHSREVQAVDDHVITYQIDTAGGQSGAPVWQLMQDGNRYGVGVHTNGALSGNSATRITGEVFNNIISWVGLVP